MMLTYNSVHVDKALMVEHVKEKMKGVMYVGVCHEVGKEEKREHTHVLVELEGRCDMKSERLSWKGKVPNVKPATSKKHWTNMMAYIHKEDTEALEWGESSAEAKGATLTGQDIMGYETMEEALLNNDIRLATNIKTVWENVRKEDEGAERKELKYHPWQERLMDVLGYEMTERNIVWVYDRVGGTGKSTWGQRMDIDGNALYIGHLGKVADFIEVLYREKDRWDGKYMIIDLTREQERGCAIYQCIEEAAKELHVRQKYTSVKFRQRRQPRICVLANWPPEVTKLSMDRWMIYQVPKAGLTLEYEPASTHVNHWVEDGWST